jgi:putative ABC transport system permease protein
MEIGPIWRALQRNKTAYILIASQIAVTMAIIVNAISIIQERAELMSRPSGVDEDNIFYLDNVGFAPDLDYQAMVVEDLIALRSFPGVANAVVTNTVPLHGGGWSQGLQVEPGDEIDATGVAIYFVDEQGVDTFDVELVAGRNFTADEVMWYDPNKPPWPEIAIVSRAMANELFPDLPAHQVVGKTVYIESNSPLTVIGVIDRMPVAWK